MSLPVFLIILLLPGPLSSVSDNGFAGGALAPRILAYPNLARTGDGVSGMVIGPTGHTRPSVENTWVVLALAIALGLLMIPRWDVTGAAVGALAAAAIAPMLASIEVSILYCLLPYNASY